MDESGRIWILDNAIILEKRLCVVAHAGPEGHRVLMGHLTNYRNSGYRKRSKLM